MKEKILSSNFNDCKKHLPNYRNDTTPRFLKLLKRGRFQNGLQIQRLFEAGGEKAEAEQHSNAYRDKREGKGGSVYLNAGWHSIGDPLTESYWNFLLYRLTDSLKAFILFKGA